MSLKIKLNLLDVVMLLVAPLPLLLAWLLHDLVRNMSDTENTIMCLLFVPFALALPAISSMYFCGRSKTAPFGTAHLGNHSPH